MKNIYIAVDMQNDFMNKDGKLYVEGAEDIKDNVKTLYNKLYDKMDAIFYTMDMHDIGDTEISVDNPDFVNTFPPHCLRDDPGSFLIPQATGVDGYKYEDGEFMLMPDKVKVFYKDVFSVFDGNEDFENELKKLSPIDKIYVAGLSGDVCVKHLLDGLLELKDNGLEYNQIIIVENAIASLSPEGFSEYLNDIKEKYDFIDTKTVIDGIELVDEEEA